LGGSDGSLAKERALQIDKFEIGYFNGWLVVIYILLVSVFLLGILRPRRKVEWKSAGVAQAWVMALYAEMYGVPLTAYFVMAWVGRTQADAENHFNGHLWPIIFSVPEAYLRPTQIWLTFIGQLLIVSGGLLAVIGWRKIHRAVASNSLAQTGLYRFIRHPQYTGFYLFLIGSVINWPTLLTFFTLPVLCWVYRRLAIAEEQDALETFGTDYQKYMQRTGRFVPKFFG
jgi:protein-S-isoprenylcysteine O-methyltransferase Ste14